MAEYDEAFDFFLQCLPNIRRSIIPLYKANPESGRPPKFVGSSIYCQFGPFVMLLTAGHVLRAILPDHAIYPQPLREDIGGPESTRAPMLRAVVEMRRVPFERYALAKDEREDSGIIQLTIPLPMWTPLASEGFSRFDAREEYQHVLVGYPASSTRGSVRRNQRIEIKGYLTSAAPAEQYADLRADPARQLVVLFKRQKVYGKNRARVTFPNPYGMSGGAALQFHEKSPRTQSLVGIMTDWRGGVIVATRIESITQKFRVAKVDGSST